MGLVGPLGQTLLAAVGMLVKLRARCKQHLDKHIADQASDLLPTMHPPPRQRPRATESVSKSVCVEVRDRAWALMCGATREEVPSVRWSSRPVSVVEAKRNTTYALLEKETRCTLTVAFMKSVLKVFQRTLVGDKGSGMMPWIAYGDISHL